MLNYHELYLYKSLEAKNSPISLKYLKLLRIVLLIKDIKIDIKKTIQFWKKIETKSFQEKINDLTGSLTLKLRHFFRNNTLSFFYLHSSLMLISNYLFINVNNRKNILIINFQVSNIYLD